MTMIDHYADDNADDGDDAHMVAMIMPSENNIIVVQYYKQITKASANSTNCNKHG